MSDSQDASFEVNRTRGRVVQAEETLTVAKIASKAAEKELTEALKTFEEAVRRHERLLYEEGRTDA